jgi:hypothetical protein
MDGLEVFRSGIHGYGVRATRSFREGHLLLFGDGVLYREHEEFDDTYALICPGYELRDDGREGPSLYWDLTCQGRWINHSCQPNTVVDTRWKAAVQSVEAWWTAIRDIRPGDELTYDYAFAGHLAEPCFCRARLCRGLIVDPDDIADIPMSHRHLLRLGSTEEPAA